MFDERIKSNEEKGVAVRKGRKPVFVNEEMGGREERSAKLMGLREIKFFIRVYAKVT